MGERSAAQQLALSDSCGAVKGHFIIVHEPERIPEKKRPPSQTWSGAARFACELLNCRKPGTRLTVLELTWNDDIWVSDGHELLFECAFTAGIDMPDGAVAKLRHYEARGWEVWITRPGESRARKAAGPFARGSDAVNEICGRLWSVSARPAAEAGA